MILCLGLTPALQRTMIFRSMHLNDVNRLKEVVISAAGKPINTARAMAVLGSECKVAGFNGGHNGDLVNGFLAEYGIDSALTSMSSETRICSTLIDEASGDVTELVEEAPEPSHHEIDAFIKGNIALLPDCKLLVICGTLPPFSSDDFYCNFSRAAAELNIPVVIDSHKSALLSVLQDKPLMAKLNLKELETTFGCRVESEDQLIDLMGRLISNGAQSVLLTQGKDAACLLEGTQFTKFTPPAIDQHRSPIGSGDCTTAGIATALVNGGTLQDAVRLGLACGAANVETLLPAVISRERVMQLL